MLVWMADALSSKFGTPAPVPADPVDELIRTVLSQNTSDANRDAAFGALKSRYPSWQAVADAPVSVLADILRPAGLSNTRAPRIKAILGQVLGNDCLTKCRKMDVCEAQKFLVSLPGVGIKTAYVVLLFSFGKPVFPMDTHVFRIFERVGLLEAHHNTVKEHERFSALIPAGRHADLHLNLLKLGRQTCKARAPRCSECPLSQKCLFALRSSGGSL